MRTHRERACRRAKRSRRVGRRILGSAIFAIGAMAVPVGGGPSKRSMAGAASAQDHRAHSCGTPSSQYPVAPSSRGWSGRVGGRGHWRHQRGKTPRAVPCNLPTLQSQSPTPRPVSETARRPPTLPSDHCEGALPAHIIRFAHCSACRDWKYAEPPRKT